MTRALIIRLAVIACLALGYSACGQKGDLYMPEQADGQQSENQD